MSPHNPTNTRRAVNQPTPSPPLPEIGQLYLEEHSASAIVLDEDRPDFNSHERQKTALSTTSRALTAMQTREFLASLLPKVEIKDGIMDLSKYLDRGELIDQGAFGEVYKGQWRCLPASCGEIEMPRVAIKVMRAPRLRDERQRQKRVKNMRRELRVWQNLLHNHILPLLGTATLRGDDNLPVIVSPWMDNGTISEYIVKHPDVPKLPFLLNIIDALLYLHSFNPSVVHGDMKAANVLVNRFGQLFVCDFGLSRMTEDATLWITTATHAGYTTRWAPPEMLNPEDGACHATTASDVYSYAMTCFEILSGQVPFASLRTEGAVVMAVVVKNKRPDREFVSDVSDGLWDLITRCWAKDPEDRPSTKDVAKEIKQLLHLDAVGDFYKYIQPGISSPSANGPPSKGGQQDSRTDREISSPWHHIHQRFLNWAFALSKLELERSLNSTVHGQHVDEVALQIWMSQVYKRYVRSRMAEHPPQIVDCLFIPPISVDAIHTSVLSGHHDDACTMLKDLWNSLGFEEAPRLILALVKQSADQDHWVVHRFSLPDGGLTSYDCSPDGLSPNPLGWWHAIRRAWPIGTTHHGLSLGDQVQNVVRSHASLQLLEDDSVAAAGIWLNLLMGLPAERCVDMERLRDLISTEVRHIVERKEESKALFIRVAKFNSPVALN